MRVSLVCERFCDSRSGFVLCQLQTHAVSRMAKGISTREPSRRGTSSLRLSFGPSPSICQSRRPALRVLL